MRYEEHKKAQRAEKKRKKTKEDRFTHIKDSLKKKKPYKRVPKQKWVKEF